MKNFMLLFSSLMIFGCGSIKQTTVLNQADPLPHDIAIQIIGAGQSVPDGAKLLGHLKIGDTGFSIVSYDTAISEAKELARKMGGNCIQIMEHKEPSGLSTSHRIKADVYLVKTE